MSNSVGHRKSEREVVEVKVSLSWRLVRCEEEVSIEMAASQLRKSLALWWEVFLSVLRSGLEASYDFRICRMSDNCSSLVEQCKTRPVCRAGEGADWVDVSNKSLFSSKQ